MLGPMKRWIAAPFVLLGLATACAAPDVAQTPSTTSTANGDPASAGTQTSERVDPRTGGLEVGFGEWAIELEATRFVRVRSRSSCTTAAQ
jgi:hypothetical protein